MNDPLRADMAAYLRRILTPAAYTQIELAGIERAMLQRMYAYLPPTSEHDEDPRVDDAFDGLLSLRRAAANMQGLV